MREVLATLECELLDRCRFETQVEARNATFAFIAITLRRSARPSCRSRARAGVAVAVLRCRWNGPPSDRPPRTDQLLQILDLHDDQPGTEAALQASRLNYAGSYRSSVRRRRTGRARPDCASRHWHRGPKPGATHAEVRDYEGIAQPSIRTRALGQGALPSARSRLRAAEISARWVKA